MKKDKSDNLSIIFILFQSGRLTDRDKLLMSGQAFIFPTRESLYKLKLSFYVAMQSSENAHEVCCQAIHRRVELVTLEGEKIGNVAIGQNQEYLRLKIKIQD